MALTDESNGNGFYMPVAPAYGAGGNNGGFGFGGDWGWIILLLLIGWGNNGFGGFGGGFGGAYGAYGEFPWLLTGQQNINANTNSGFRDQMINDGINGIRDGIYALSTQLCNCCGDMQMSLANGFAGVEQNANARQIANMQTAFGLQTAMTQGFNGVGTQLAQNNYNVGTGLADLKYTVASENCADRQALNEGIRDVIASQTASTQKILDKLCDQELQAERRENQNLRSELMYARGQASQIEQTAQILAGQTNEVDALYTRLSNCPVPTTPVYGRTPIFTCNNGCGCSGNTGLI